MSRDGFAFGTITRARRPSGRNDSTHLQQVKSLGVRRDRTTQLFGSNVPAIAHKTGRPMLHAHGDFASGIIARENETIA